MAYLAAIAVCVYFTRFAVAHGLAAEDDTFITVAGAMGIVATASRVGIIFADAAVSASLVGVAMAIDDTTRVVGVIETHLNRDIANLTVWAVAGCGAFDTLAHQFDFFGKAMWLICLGFAVGLCTALPVTQGQLAIVDAGK